MSFIFSVMPLLSSLSATRGTHTVQVDVRELGEVIVGEAVVQALRTNIGDVVVYGVRVGRRAYRTGRALGGGRAASTCC